MFRYSPIKTCNMLGSSLAIWLAVSSYRLEFRAPEFEFDTGIGDTGQFLSKCLLRALLGLWGNWMHGVGQILEV